MFFCGEKDNQQSFLDMIVRNNKIYHRYYSKRTFDNQNDMLDFINYLVLEKGYVLDSEKINSYVILKNYNTNIEYTCWNDNVIEKLQTNYICDLSVDNNF